MAKETIPQETVKVINERTKEGLIGWWADPTGKPIWGASVEDYALLLDASSSRIRLAITTPSEGIIESEWGESPAELMVLHRLLLELTPRKPTDIEKAIKKFDDILNRL